MAVWYYIWCIFAFCLACDAASIGIASCYYSAGGNIEQSNLGTRTSQMTGYKILKNPKFWDTFAHEVKERKSWKCDFPQDILLQNFEVDSSMYKDDSVFRNRRIGVKKWLEDDDLWATTVLEACKEIATGTKGTYSEALQRYKILEALEDYVYHIHYFNEVAAILNARSEKVIVLSQHQSPIHDIDKLDPVMLVSYSERFEDNKTTTLWDKCVTRHTYTNPHHQAHCSWQKCCRCGKMKTRTHFCPNCDSVRETALREMICDKVSRKLQKNLDGVISDDMWNVDMNFFSGIPQEWLDKASALMEKMRQWSIITNESN